MNTSINTYNIPLDFEKVYGLNSKYAFISCIYELRNYIEELTPLMKEDYTGEIRHILHQMTGTAGLLLNEDICRQIESIRHAIKVKKEYESTVKEVAKLDMELSRIHHQILHKYPSKKILIYGESTEDLAMVSFKISSWNANVQITKETTIEQLDSTVSKYLPEVLVIFANREDELLAHIVGIIQKRYLGTAIFYLEEQRDWLKLKEIVKARM